MTNVNTRRRLLETSSAYLGLGCNEADQHRREIADRLTRGEHRFPGEPPAVSGCERERWRLEGSAAGGCATSAWAGA